MSKLVKYIKDEGNVMLKEELLKQLESLLLDKTTINNYNEGKISTKEAATLLLREVRNNRCFK